MGKNSFVMYNDWSSLVGMLSDEQSGELLKAIYDYHCGNKEKPKDKMVLGIYEMMCKRFEADALKYEKICIRNRQNGANGGRPKGSQNKPTGFSEEPRETQKNPVGKSGLIWVSDNDNDNDNELIKERDKREKVAKAPRSPFRKPTVDEVSQYCHEHGYQVDANNFVDFYTSKGWKVGKEPMKDWQACVRTWARRDEKKKVTQFQQNNYDFGLLEEQLLDN